LLFAGRCTVAYLAVSVLQRLYMPHTTFDLGTYVMYGNIRGSIFEKIYNF
jgi:hypothetical protein